VGWVERAGAGRAAGTIKQPLRTPPAPGERDGRRANVSRATAPPPRRPLAPAPHLPRPGGCTGLLVQSRLPASVRSHASSASAAASIRRASASSSAHVPAAVRTPSAAARASRVSFQALPLTTHSSNCPSLRNLAYLLGFLGVAGAGGGRGRFGKGPTNGGRVGG
jgi:hypothetical protein